MQVVEFFQSETGVAVSISSLVTLGVALLSHWLKGRVRLIAFSPDSSVFKFDPPAEGGHSVLINSGQVILQNQGRIAAEEVEVIAGPGQAPAGFNIVPRVGHSVYCDASGRWTLSFPFIAPKEAITIQLLNGPPIETIRCKGGAAKYVPVMYQRIFPAWFNVLALMMFFFGVFSTAYWLLILVF